MPFYVLSINNSTLDLDVQHQIDNLLLQHYAGNPNGHLAAAVKGVFCYDNTNNNLYMCTTTDGSGNPANTTWTLQNLVVNYATTSAPGIVQLAATYNSSDAVLALTGASLAGVFAHAGINSDITQLTGLTTPLSQGQGGTGQPTFLQALKNALPAMSGNAGKVFGTDGANITLVAQASYTGGVLTPTSPTQLSLAQEVVLSTDNLQHTMPPNPSSGTWVAISPRGVTNVTLVTSDGSTIEGSSNPFQIDRSYSAPFRFVFFSNNWTYGA